MNEIICDLRILNDTERTICVEIRKEENRIYPEIKADAELSFERYDGEYNVTPLITAQVLQTKDKLLTDNVTVEMIPTREIEGINGGVAFIVG